MKTERRIFGLSDFGLSPSEVSASRAMAEISIQQSVPITSRLRALPPRRRLEALDAELQHGLDRIRKVLATARLRVRGRKQRPWTIEATVPLCVVPRLLKLRTVGHVDLSAVRGRVRRRPRPRLAWFAVWAEVAIQVEGCTTGLTDIEDRLMLVRAWSSEDAERRLEGEWKRYAAPYLNARGELVRWQKIRTREVYGLMDSTINPKGTEVFSKLRGARITEALRWPPQWTAANGE